ncbi:MAG TPA: DUF4388 domain-containing protein, partial [Kofleriaceae bacterium]|nr:DUF4388 domain-containing protein [Kofleriaceae bacterium]
MLLSGTLADLDLPGIAAMTSLGRASLRLELRASGGDLIGSLVLKAGRVVSATAGAAHGRDALRVLLSSASDARFEVAHEPLDFALSSSVASLEELGELRRAPGLPPVRRATTELGATATGVGPAPTDHARITAFAMARAERPVMEGALSEFDLPTLLHTIGCSRKFCALEIGDGQTTHGTIYVKSGIVVAAIAGPFTGIPAVQHLIASHRGGRFRLVQLAGEVPDDAPLGPIGQVLLHVDAPAPAVHAASAAVAASGTALTATALDERTRPLLPADTVADTVIEDRSRPAPPADAVVMEGKLSELDVRTVLEVLAATRQHA